MMAKERHRQDSRQRRPSQHNRSAPSRSATAAARQHDGAGGESFGKFVEKDRQEDQPSQPVRNQESGSDGDPVEKGVNDQTNQHRVTAVDVDEFIGVRFFAEMEVRSNRVLKKMNDEVSQQHKQCGGS